jgi:hypothetical protein
VGYPLLGGFDLFNLFFVKFRFIQPDGLVMKDFKPALLGVLPRRCSFNIC